MIFLDKKEKKKCNVLYALRGHDLVHFAYKTQCGLTFNSNFTIINTGNCFLFELEVRGVWVLKRFFEKNAKLGREIYTRCGV